MKGIKDWAKSLFGGGKGLPQDNTLAHGQPVDEKVITPAQIATDIDNCIAKLPKCGLSEEEIAKYKDCLAQIRDQMKTPFKPQCDVKNLYTALDQIFQEPIMEIFTYGNAKQRDDALTDIQSSIDAIEENKDQINICICMLEIQIYHASEYYLIDLVNKTEGKKTIEENNEEKLKTRYDEKQIDFKDFTEQLGAITMKIKGLKGAINEYKEQYVGAQSKILSLETAILQLKGDTEALKKKDEISEKLTKGMVDPIKQKMAIQAMREKTTAIYSEIETYGEEMEEEREMTVQTIAAMIGLNPPTSSKPDSKLKYNQEAVHPAEENETQSNDIPNIIA